MKRNLNLFKKLINIIKNNKELLIYGISLLAAIRVVLFLYHNITLNYPILGIIIIFIWLLIFGGYNFFQKKSRRLRTNGTFIVGKENAEFAMLACLALIIIGSLTIHTIDNYFYPNDKIYRNIDHHVLRLDGARITEPTGYIVAQNSDAAFLDNKKINGKMSISNYNDSTVSLNLYKFTNAIYENIYDNDKRCTKRNLLNKNQLLHFNDGNKGDTVYFRLSNKQVIKFYTHICEDNRIWSRVHKLPCTDNTFVFDHRKDSATYCLQWGDSTHQSEERRIIISGLSLVDILKGINIPDSIPNVDFSGINIVRPTILPTVKNDTKIFDYDSIGYNIEYCGGSIVDKENTLTITDICHVADISSDTLWHPLRTNADTTITIPYNTAFNLGFPLNSGKHIYFSKDSTNDDIYINYRQPKRAYLQSETQDKKFDSLYVTTSLAGNAEQLQEVPEQIILFDEFNNFENSNNITPFTLSYIAGPTNQDLEFIVQSNDIDTLTTKNRAIVPIKRISSLDGNLEWMINIEDLKQTSYCQPSQIKRNILFLTLALAILILIGAVRFFSDNEEKEKRNTFTLAEFVIYSVILYMVSFRWFLLWRISVFPPLEGVSYYEYETLFRGIKNMSMLNQFLTIFIATILIAKCTLIYGKQCLYQIEIWIHKLHEIWIHKLQQKEWYNKVSNHVTIYINKFRYSRLKKHITVISITLHKWDNFIPLWPIVGYLLVFVIAFAFSGTPAISIAFTVIGFILSIAYNNYKLLGHYKLEDQQYDFLSIMTPFSKFLLIVLANIISYLVIFYCIDTGYAILFLTFCVFYLIWLLHEYVTMYMSEEVYDKRRDWWVLLLFVGYILLLYYYKDVFHFILDHAWWEIGISFSLVSFVVLWIVCYSILNIRRKGAKSLLWIIAISIIIGVAGICVEYIAIKKAANTTNRITVHFSSPEDVMASRRTESDVQRYMEAALNHMIIGEYEERGREVNIYGEQSYGYFKMQPHSKVGALWNAQLTDISMVRFCIAEHGIWLPFCFMLAFIVMLFISIRMPLYHRWARSILVLIPLLFTVQSILVWMANTQRFIFLGQDFPLVSINSRLTLTFFFGLTIIWMAIILYEKVNFHKLYEDNDDAYDLRLDNDWRYEVARRDSLKVGVIMLASLIACAIVSHTGGKKENTFAVDSLMNDIQKEVDEHINPLLVEYQRENGCIKLSNNIHKQIVDFDKEKDITNVLKKESNDSLVIHLWRNFVDEGSLNNSSKLVMHARLANDTIKIGKIPQKPLQIKVVRKYYNKRLPRRTGEYWKGSFIAYSSSNSGSASIQGSTYILPQDWVEESNTVALVVNNRGRYNATVKKDYNVKYLARNVRVNGIPTFIYPLEEKFYWIRNFAEQAAHQKNKEIANRLNVKDKNRDVNNYENIEMTISPSLTKTLYNRLKSSTIIDPNIMVANGDGNVVAMVNYDKDYHLNPNDSRAILALYDSIYMYALNGSQLEQRAFSNSNLAYLPCGPGSSQKPLLWTAVASAIDYPWKDLAIRSYYNHIDVVVEKKTKKFIIPKFNGQPFRKRDAFKPLCSDENSGEVVSLEGFMTHSSNVYNALMAYIGSFTSQTDIDNINSLSDTKDDELIFAKLDKNIDQIRRMSKEEYEDNFPILFQRNHSSFTLNKEPDYKNQKRSILERQMKALFLDDKYSSNKRLSSTAGVMLNTNDTVNYFAYSSKSRLQDRGTSKYNFMEKGIRSTAIGAQSVWDITPWKMAESYGRMASLNKNYTLSVVNQPKYQYERFDLLSGGYVDARGTLMRGMGKVLYDAKGTAKNVGYKLGLKNSNIYQGYYLYAKTGTTDNGLEGHKHKEYHRLGVIISDTDLEKAKIKDLKSAKFYVVYFAVRNKGNKWDLYSNCIKDIVNSEEFKNYMAK